MPVYGINPLKIPSGTKKQGTECCLLVKSIIDSEAYQVYSSDDPKVTIDLSSER